MVAGFSTARLDAKPLDESHLAELCVMHDDPDVMIYLGGVRDAETTRQYIADSIDHWARHGFGTWGLRAKDGTFAGRCALRHIEIDGVDEVEIGYSLTKEFWGQVLATEVAAKLVEIAFDECGLTDIIAFAVAEHAASRRVMEKVGFHFECEKEIQGAYCALYRLSFETDLRSSSG